MIRLMIAATAICFSICIAAASQDDEEPRSRERRFTGLRVSSEPHPQVVSLLYYGDHICSGTLLLANIVLTAAHCVAGKWHEKLIISLKGTNHKIQKTEFAATNIEYHSEFHSVDFINDVALVKLRRPVPLSGFISATKLPPEPRNVSEGTTLTYYNWASIVAGPNRLSARLVKDQLSVISKDDCAKMYRDVTVDSLQGQFCANFTTSYDGYSGDTGGPLMVYGYQVGIVSTSQCGQKVLPEISTDISAVLGWILRRKEELRTTRLEYSVIHPLTQGELDYYRSWHGYLAITREVPWIVALVDTNNGEFIGVGSIISNDVILTTAQCAKKVTATVKAYVGKVDDKYGEQEHTIVQNHIHEDYNEHVSLYLDDIALLQVSPEFTFSETVGKVSLHKEDEQLEANMPATIYGWLEEEGLRFLNLSMSRDDECSWLYGSHGGLSPGQLCAKSRFGLCSRNSGEPLIVGPHLVGMLTRTNPECADYRYPGIFTKVSHYRSWIDSKLHHFNEREEGGLRK